MKRWFSLFLAVCLAAACIGMFSSSAETLAPLSQVAADKPETEIILPDACAGELAPDMANIRRNQPVSYARFLQRSVPIPIDAGSRLPFRTPRMDKPSSLRLPMGSPARICHAGRAP